MSLLRPVNARPPTRTRNLPRAPDRAARGPPASSSSTQASSSPRVAGSLITRWTGKPLSRLRTRVNRIILEDLEQKVLALRALHAKLREMDAGESFGAVVARSRPV